MTNFYSNGVGNALQGVSINNDRRIFGFGDSPYVATLAVEESIFVSTLMAMSKKRVSDPVFKHLERRHQWQRRNFEIQADVSATTINSAFRANPTIAGVRLTVDYDKFGREVGQDTQPIFLLPNQTVTLVGRVNVGPGNSVTTNTIIADVDAVTDLTNPAYAVVNLRIRAVNGYTDLSDSAVDGKTLAFTDGDPGQITGTAFAEGTGAPDGYTDAFYNREGYTQIFKTSIPNISGTMQATVYRGEANEYARIWNPKMKEHKMDLSTAMLFNIGGISSEGGAPKRYTNGFFPYVERYGVVQPFSYATTGQKAFLEWLEVFMAPEKGGQRLKYGIASRRIMSWLNHLGEAGYISNTVGRGAFRMEVHNVPSQIFGHNVTLVKTVHGDIAFSNEVHLRGPYADYAAVYDPPCLHFNVLAGNGVSRDTFVKTNVQGNDVDARKDLITTEAGLQIDLPELHAVLKFS